ncbi:MAG: gas vesicle protein GvpO [Pseudomonadota bacterium]
MAEQPKATAFADATVEVLTMPEALNRAREALAMINPAPLDCVSSCELREDGTWHATLDVIESPARMGDNDLLSSYEMTLKSTGELVDLRRTGRFYREDRVIG